MSKQKLFSPEKVILHYKCCECGARHQEPLSEAVNIGISICGECNKMENFLEVEGVTIKHTKNKKEG